MTINSSSMASKNEDSIGSMESEAVKRKERLKALKRTAEQSKEDADQTKTSDKK